MPYHEIKCESHPWEQHYGPGTKPYLGEFEFSNVAEMATKTSERWAKNKAFSLVLANGADASLTYEEVNTYSNYVAIYLKEVVKLKKGDRVALQMPNCLAYPVVAFGVIKAGGVIVNTNPLYTPMEMSHQFYDSEAKVLFIIDMFADKLTGVLPNTSIEKVILVDIAHFFPFFTKTLIQTVLKYVKKQIPKCDVPTTSFADVIQHGKQLQRSNGINVTNYWKDIKLSDLCALQYTGGTTGVSKGAMLSHGNFIANMYQIIEMGRAKILFGEECVLTAIPLYHIFAFSVNLVSFYYCGGHNILIPNPRPLVNLKKALQNYPVTWFAGVNTLFNALLNESWFVENPPKYLRASISGGSALHKSVAAKWFKVTKVHIVEGFGLTEASPVVSFNPISGKIKEETVGIPVPNTEVVILNEQGVPVAIGNAGEIAVKGPQVMQGYWQRPEETKKVLKDGWLLTGDIGVMDAEGYIKIVDRKKDLIIVSGFNVYPNEIEDCIAKLDGVEEVAVVGIPSEKTDEAVKAYIVKKDPNLTTEQVIAHCRKFLTPYKVPKVVEFRKDLPKSPIGKILRKSLRGEATQAAVTI